MRQRVRGDERVLAPEAKRSVEFCIVSRLVMNVFLEGEAMRTFFLPSSSPETGGHSGGGGKRAG